MAAALVMKGGLYDLDAPERIKVDTILHWRVSCVSYQFSNIDWLSFNIRLQSYTIISDIQ